MPRYCIEIKVLMCTPAVMLKNIIIRETLITIQVLKVVIHFRFDILFTRINFKTKP